MKKIMMPLLCSMKSTTRQVRPYFNVAVKRVQFKCHGFSKRERRQGKLFRAGNWDLNKKSIADVRESDPRYLFYREYFIDNIPLKDTTIYHYHLSRQDRDKPRIGFETKDALLAQLEGYVKIFRDIERDGRVTPAYELKGHRGDEIGCILGRDGEVLKVRGGNNRFAIASLLQLPTVPIQIDFMHSTLLGEVVMMSGILPSQKINRFLQDRIE